MSEPTYREAHDRLRAFVQNFAAPLLAILPVLEKTTEAEVFLAELEDKTKEVEDRKLVAQQAVEQATRDRQTVLDSIERDRAIYIADSQRQVEAYRLQSAQIMTELETTVTQRRMEVTADLLTLDQQIEQRKVEQRQLDSDIQKYRVMLENLKIRVEAATKTIPG